MCWDIIIRLHKISACQQNITLMQSGYYSDDRAISAHVGQEEGADQLKFEIIPSRAADPEVKAMFLELNIVI